MELQKEAALAKVDILGPVERRRTWTAEEKAALLAEIDAEGGRVRLIARRHQMAESVLYNWLSARRAAAMAMGAPADVTFVPIGVIANCAAGAPARLAASTEPTSLRALPDQGKGGQIEINLPSGARVCVDMSVDEKALSRVLRAVKGAT